MTGKSPETLPCFVCDECGRVWHNAAPARHWTRTDPEVWGGGRLCPGVPEAVVYRREMTRHETLRFIDQALGVHLTAEQKAFVVAWEVNRGRP